MYLKYSELEFEKNEDCHSKINLSILFQEKTKRVKITNNTKKIFPLIIFLLRLFLLIKVMDLFNQKI